MNIKTLILVLCITFISSHPVKEEMTTTTEKMTTTTEKMTTEKEDLCKDNFCNENQVCTPNSFDYECDCRPGYSGYNCNRYDACFDVTCLNNGIKSSFGGKCECACLGGSTGKFCENSIRK